MLRRLLPPQVVDRILESLESGESVEQVMEQVMSRGRNVGGKRKDRRP
jgi:hypothetical protein